MNSIDETLIQLERRAFTVGSDFTAVDSLAAFSTVEGDASASVALATGASAVGGKALLTTGAVDNAEAYVFTQEVFTFSAKSTVVAEAFLDFTEGNTDDANIIFGLMSGVAANALLDNGGGPAAAYDGAVIYKVDGGLVWQAEASTDGGANQSGGTSTTLTTQTGPVTLRIECSPLTATRMDVSFLVDVNGGSNFVPLRDTNLIPLKYEMDISTVAEMSLMVGVKAGGANSETPLVDKITATQIRFENF